MKFDNLNEKLPHSVKPQYKQSDMCILLNRQKHYKGCLLYTSDAADDMQCVDLGGRRIIKKMMKSCVCVVV